MKKLLSLVLAVCMIMSAFGTVTAFGATASGGAGGGGGGDGVSDKLDNMLADFNNITEANVEVTINTYMDVLLGVTSDMDAFYAANKAIVNEAVIAGKPYANVGEINNTIFDIYAADKLKNAADVDTFKATLEYYSNVFGIDVTVPEYIAGASEINNRLFNDRANITNDNIADKYANALMLSEFNSATRDEVPAVLNKYAAKLGITVNETYIDSIKKVIAADGVVFNSAADVVRAFNEGIAYGKENTNVNLTPSTPSGGGGGSAGGGGGGGVSGGGVGGSSSGGSSSGGSSLANGYVSEIYMDLICDDTIDENGKFYSGDLEFAGNICVSAAEKTEVFVAAALYDDNGVLVDFAFRVKTVSSSDGEFSVAIPDVNTPGIIKCMLIDATTLSPLCPAKEFKTCSDSLKVGLHNIDCSYDTSLIRQENFDVKCYVTDEATMETTIDISALAEVYVNGAEVYSSVNLGQFCNRYSGTVEFVENTDDKYVDRINITAYQYGIVDEVLADKGQIVLEDGSKIILDGDPLQCVNICDKTGDAITINDINPGDVLAVVVEDIGYNGIPVKPGLYFYNGMIYDLGDTSFDGTISGISYDRVQIDNKWYKYGTEYSDSYFAIYLGRTARFYKGIFGEIIGMDLYRDCEYGLILQTRLDTTGFESQYQIKMLTENHGIVVYYVDTECSVDGNVWDVNYQSAYLDFDEYDSANIGDRNNPKTDISYRMVQYYTNVNGEIDDICFLKNMYRLFEFRPREGEYYKPDATLWGVALTDETIIFNVSDGAREACRITKDNLYDEAEYEGYMIRDSYSDDYNIMIIYSGTIFKEETEEEETIESNLGFVLASESDMGLDGDYQMSVLTETEGIVTYDVASKCTINGYRYATGEQGEFLNIPRYTKDGDESDRVIDFKLNSEGKINNITFVNTEDVFVGFSGKQYSDRIGDIDISYKSVIFDLTDDNLSKAKTITRFELYTNSIYSGVATAIDINGKYNIVVLNDLTLRFQPEAHLIVVDSAQATSYDGEDAVMINYYTGGINRPWTAVFTEDSINAFDSQGEYRSLGKGSLLEAVIDENGFVCSYAVIANVNAGGYPALSGSLNALTKSIYGVNEVGNSKQDKMEFVYGYISDIKGKTLTLGGTVANDFTDGRDFVIDARVAQYTYSTEGTKPKIVVGDYLARGVDVFDDGKANLVLLKVYDDELLDIISFSERATGVAPGIIAQTHYTGPGLDLN